MKKRKLINELMQGFDALEADREGKVAIKKVLLTAKPVVHEICPASPFKR